MTDKEWKKSTNIEQMLECLVDRQFPDAEPCNWKRGERKKRLFVRACLTRIRHLLPSEFKAVCDMLEAEIDRKISKEKRETTWSDAEGISDELDELLFALGYDDIGLLCYIAAGMAAGAASTKGISRKESRRQREHRQQASLLREIFGDPFRPVVINSAWLTPGVIELAQTIYDEQAFERMHELADTLEKADCDNADLLNHCRSGGEHVRGCWIVDLVLGKA